MLLAPVGLLYLVSGLVVPQPWLTGLWAVWIVAAFVTVRNRHRPWWVVGTPLAAVALWFAIVSLGEALLDWTA